MPPAVEQPAVPEPGALVLHLPDEQRASADLRVNNVRVRIPDSEPWEIPSRPGTYQVRLARKGFEPYEATVRVEPGEKVSLKPEWVPTARLVFHWPVEAREGARLQVDGRPVPLPSDPDSPDEFEIPAQPGARLVWADRRGYQSFSRTIELARGEAQRVAVEWHAPAPSEAAVAAVPSPPEPKPVEQPQAQPQPDPEPQPAPEPPGPTPEEVAAMEALEALEAKWRAATEGSEQKVAVWDFAGALGALESVRFDDEQLASRLARRKDELRRMAALKERMIAGINEADPPLKKADLMLRGFAGELTGADAQAITATLATGKEETLPWGDLGTQAPGRLLQLVVDKSSADDWLSAGVFALGIGEVELAERLLARAGEMGVDIGPYRGPLARAAFDAARALLDAGEFAKAAHAFTALESKYAGTPWLSARRTALAAARAAAEQGAHEAEAEKLYAEAVGYFEKEQLFDVRPLVERLKADYANTRAVTDDARNPPFGELEAAVADLGDMFTVRLDGKGDFKSIQEALDAAPPNSLIEIQDNGPYNEAIVINKPGTTLRGKKGNWPIITSADMPAPIHTLVRVSAPRVQLEQVVIVHTRTGGAGSTVITGRAGQCRMVRAVVFCHSHGASHLAHLDHVIMASTVHQTGTPLHVANSFWLRGDPVRLGDESAFDNVLLQRGILQAGQIELRRCTVLAGVRLSARSVVSDSILPSVHSDGEGVVIEFSNVHGRAPFVEQARPGKGCFSAPPVFVDAKNFDYRLVPGSPGTGKASDGGDVGVRYTPEMIEMLKLALELRARGIIEF